MFSLLFLLAAIFQVFVSRHHQKEKKYGPSPKNNYTSGSGGKFWKRKPKTTKDAYANGNNAELGGVGATGGMAHTNGRSSYETGYTSNNTSDAYGSMNNKYEAPHSGYHTGPTGTSVNPYGYNNATHPTGTAVNY